MCGTTQPEELVRKSDIPRHSSGTVVKLQAFVLPLLLIGLIFIDPETQDARPGILDGVLGGILGVVMGWMSGRWYLIGTQHDLLERKKGNKRWWLHGIRKHDFPVLALLLTAALGSSIIGLIFNWLSLDWPLVGKNPTSLAGICGFVGSSLYRYAEWYDSLPD